MKKSIKIATTLAALAASFVVGRLSNPSTQEPFCVNAGDDGVVKAQPYNITVATRLKDGATQIIPAPFEVLKKNSQNDIVACPKE